MRTEHRIIIGDARNMTEQNNESIQLIITSPPYWQLKDYGDKRQIGFDNSYEDNQLINQEDNNARVSRKMDFAE